MNNNYNYYRENMEYNLVYIDEILRNNIGKNVKIYVSYPDSLDCRDKTFEGTILQCGKDYILIKENDGNNKILIWSIYINYLEFK